MLGRLVVGAVLCFGVVVPILVHAQSDESYGDIHRQGHAGNGIASCCESQCGDSDPQRQYPISRSNKWEEICKSGEKPDDLVKLWDTPGHPFVYGDTMNIKAKQWYSRDCCVCPPGKEGRVIILMADTRDPTKGFKEGAKLGQTHYHTKAALVNQMYAKRYGYDFRYVIPAVWSSMREHIRKAANLTGSYIDCKKHPVTYKWKQNSARAGAWTKLPAVWHYTYKYDWVVHIDSDSVFRNHSWSLQRSLSAMRNEQDFLLISDMAYEFRLPCTGIFVMRGGARGRARLETWWNVTDYAHIKGIYEQRGMRVRGMADFDSKEYDPDFSKAGVRLDVPQFYQSGRRWPVPGNHSWVTHIGTGERHNREKVLNQLLGEFGIDTDQKAAEAVKPLAGSVTWLDTTEVSMHMEHVPGGKAHHQSMFEGKFGPVC